MNKMSEKKQQNFMNLFREYCAAHNRAGKCDSDRDCDFCCVDEAYNKIFEEEEEEEE